MHRSLIALIFLLLSCFLSAQPAGWQEVKEKYAKGRVYAGIRTCGKYLSGKAPQNEFKVLRAEGFNRIAENEKALRDGRDAYATLPDPYRKWAARQIGIAMAALGAPDSARHWLELSVGTDDNNDTWYRLGLLDKASGNYGSARMNFDRVVQDAPDHLAALMERGACKALLGDSVGARADLDLAVQKAPRDPVAWNSHGYYVHALRGDHRSAIADYDKAIKLDPNYSYAFNNRGWSYYKLGDKDKALRNINLAGKKKRGNPFVARNLGVIALESGETESACAHLRNALAMRFTELHGDEVERLIREHCGRTVPVGEEPPAVPQTPVPPRSNAPGRTNAP